MKLTQVEDFENRPYLSRADACYYLREFTAQKGFAFSETNQLISNLKKSPARRSNSWEWRHKEHAIRQCVDEFVEAFRLEDPKSQAWLDEATLAQIPPSKAVDDPLYDDRIERILQGIAASFGRPLDIRRMVTQRTSIAAAHETDQRPKPEDLKALYDPRVTGKTGQR